MNPPITPKLTKLQSRVERVKNKENAPYEEFIAPSDHGGNDGMIRALASLQAIGMKFFVIQHESAASVLKSESTSLWNSSGSET